MFVCHSLATVSVIRRTSKSTPRLLAALSGYIVTSGSAAEFQNFSSRFQQNVGMRHRNYLIFLQ